MFCTLPTVVLAAVAQPTPEGAKMARAVRADSAIAIDGRLEEAAWRVAEPARDFVQREPRDGVPADFATEVRVLYDDHNVYVGVKAFDPEPSAASGLLTRRDTDSPSDWVWVGFDSYADRRTSFVFGINPAGVLRDKVIYADGAQEDESWDAVWEGSASWIDDGWTAELRIPLSQLRFAASQEQRWGFQVLRIVARTHETSTWSPWPRQSPGVVSQFGVLEGIRDVSTGGRLELIPYAVGGAHFERGAQTRARANAGLDARLALASSVVLNVTLNPDFGQVEADPSSVNLTASETFLPEKRPFFLEGTDLLRFRLSQGSGTNAVDELFYSRRIGAPPHGAPSDATVRAPQQTTIYAAAKLGGKTAAGWSVAALDAVTAEESVRTAAGREVLQPLTNYSVWGVQKDLRGGRTHLAGALTSVVRRLEDTGIDDLHTHAHAAGVSVSHRFWDDAWLAEAKLMGSLVGGSEAALLETQTASQRYYQRPDARHLRLDPTRTRLFGVSGQYMVGKVAKGNWQGLLGGDTRSPGFEVNDLGFALAADFAVPWFWLSYRDEEPGEILRDWRLDLDTWSEWDYSGLARTAGASLNLTIRLLNYWGGYTGVNYEHNRWSTRLLRGGPAVRAVPRANTWLVLNTDPQRAVRATLAADLSYALAGASQRQSYTAEIVTQARSNLRLSVAPAVARLTDDLQYVDTVDSHYILGRVEQTTLSLTLRVDYTVSPTLSLQLYAQPFASSGRFPSYREVDAPRAQSYDARYPRLAGNEITRAPDQIIVDRDGDGIPDYSFEPADFAVRETNASLVVRWQPALGSALFLVWSHARASESSEPRQSLGEHWRALSRTPGEHVVLAKLSVWVDL